MPAREEDFSCSSIQRQSNSACGQSDQFQNRPTPSKRFEPVPTFLCGQEPACHLLPTVYGHVATSSWLTVSRLFYAVNCTEAVCDGKMTAKKRGTVQRLYTKLYTRLYKELYTRNAVVCTPLCTHPTSHMARGVKWYRPTRVFGRTDLDVMTLPTQPGGII